MSSTDAALIVPAGDAEVVALPDGGAFHLLADAGRTGGAVGVNRLTLGTGRDGAAVHFHRKSAELFFVLSGAVLFLLGEELVTLTAGGLVVVPPGMAHAFGAAPDSAAELLVMLAPGTDRFEYFRRLGRIQNGEAGFEILHDAPDRFDVHLLPAFDWRSATARSSGDEM